LFSQISAGSHHTCGVTLVGQAYCWGLDDNGQLGINSLTGRVRPVLVQGGRRWAFVEAGGFHTCGITTDDKAFCWGDNARGALGNNGGVDRLVPVQVAGTRRYRRVSAGLHFSCAVSLADKAFCWGENLWGQLGNGDRDDEDAPHSEYQTPTAVAGGLSFRQISAGSSHTCGRTLGGQAYCWGLNLRGSLGDGSLDQVHLTPQAVSGGLSYKQLVVGTSGTCGVTTADRAYCWGFNFAGALGNGTTGDRRVPTAVAGGFLFSNVSMGGNHTCGVTTGGPALCWGLNTSGQLGLGTVTGPELCPPNPPGIACSREPEGVVAPS
jgi:alpha-tubulin suppressor-like RCC1 family protein